MKFSNVSYLSYQKDIILLIEFYNLLSKDFNLSIFFRFSTRSSMLHGNIALVRSLQLWVHITKTSSVF